MGVDEIRRWVGRRGILPLRMGGALVAAGLIARDANTVIGVATVGIGLVATLLGIYGWTFEPADPEE